MLKNISQKLYIDFKECVTMKPKNRADQIHKKWSRILFAWYHRAVQNAFIDDTQATPSCILM